MTETLRVRVYNVRFGDAILISAPDRSADGDTMIRHLLIDVGNVMTGEGGADEIFEPVLDDILAVLDGDPLDVYLMTHEHMDHVQGLLYASKIFNKRLTARHAWLTGSSAPNYYETHDEARRKLQLSRLVYRLLEAYSLVYPNEMAPFKAVMLNNNPRSTSDCVDFLRQVASDGQTVYVHREFDLTDNHPFQEVKIELWAPEEDTSEYYGRFRPMSLGVAMGGDDDQAPQPLRLVPPAGVDADTFYNLVAWRRRGFADNLMAIDKAANNSSVVLCLEWRGWRLLFPGDAEIRSWKTMDREQQLKPVHFLKVSHHGSHNGTPIDLLDQLLPQPAPDHRDRYAVVCTYPEVYPGIPDEGSKNALQDRCTWHTVEDLVDGGYYDFEFDDDGASRVKAVANPFSPSEPEDGEADA